MNPRSARAFFILAAILTTGGLINVVAIGDRSAISFITACLLVIAGVGCIPRTLTPTFAHLSQRAGMLLVALYGLNVVRLAVKWSESTGWSQPANWIAAGMGASALLTFAYLWATPAASDKSSSSKTRPSARSSWRFGPLTTVATAAVAIAVVIVAKQQLMPSSALAVGSSNNDAERIRIDMYDPKEERNSSNAAAFENELQRIGARIGDTAGRVTDRELWLDVLDRDIIPPSPSTTRSSRDE